MSPVKLLERNEIPHIVNKSVQAIRIEVTANPDKQLPSASILTGVALGIHYQGGLLAGAKMQGLWLHSMGVDRIFNRLRFLISLGWLF